MRKLSPKVLLILAAILSVICGIMIYSYLSKSNKAADQAKETKPVVVAAMDIAPDTVLTEEMLRVELVPPKLAQSDALTTLKDAVGKPVKMAVNSGDQITRKRMRGIGASNSFVAAIPKDKRAITINVDPISGVGGFITPSSYVDVISVEPEGKGKPTTGKMVLQNVLVLAVGSSDISSGSGKKGENAGSVTLAVSTREAVKLRVAQQLGKISLLLRPDKPEEEETFGNTVYADDAAPQQAAPAPGYSGGAPGMPPVQSSGIKVIRGTNIGH